MAGGFPLGLEVSNGNDVGSTLGTTFGTQVTPSASANTYGSYAQLVASTPFDACFAVITFNLRYVVGDAGAFKIATGTAGSEQVIVADFVISDFIRQAATVAIPLAIKAGSRIAAACASSGATETGFGYVNIQLFDGAFTQIEGYAGVDSIGFVAASTIGTTITAPAGTNTKGNYSQLIASTSKDYAGFYFAMDALGATVTGNCQFLFDIAVGAAAAEQVIHPNQYTQLVTTSGNATPQIVGPIYVPIQAGSRIAARCQSDTTVKAFGLTLYGMYQ